MPITKEQVFARIRHAFDDLAARSTDPLSDFCSGNLPADLPELSAETLGQLRYVPGRHAGVSEDAPEVLAQCALLGDVLLIVGYDDHAGGHGMAAPYDPARDVLDHS